MYDLGLFLYKGLDIISTLFWVTIFIVIAKNFVKRITGAGVKEEKTPKAIKKQLKEDKKSLREFAPGTKTSQVKSCERKARIQLVRKYPAWKPILFKEEYLILAYRFLALPKPTTDEEESSKWEHLLGNYIVERETLL